MSEKFENDENKLLGFSGRTNRLGKRVVFTGLVEDNRL
jgi:hypothetical protein